MEAKDTFFTSYPCLEINQSFKNSQKILIIFNDHTYSIDE